MNAKFYITHCKQYETRQNNEKIIQLMISMTHKICSTLTLTWLSKNWAWAEGGNWNKIFLLRITFWIIQLILWTSNFHVFIISLCLMSKFGSVLWMMLREKCLSVRWKQNTSLIRPEIRLKYFLNLNVSAPGSCQVIRRDVTVPESRDGLISGYK